MTKPVVHPDFDTPARHAGDGEGESRQRWRTVFVDGTILDSTTPSFDDKPAAEPRTRTVTRLDDEVAAVRKNVQDSARAVLAWLSAVVAHEGKTDLDDILDRCLRPGPDIERVNFAAMAEDIFRVTGVELSAKRVQTAVTHLRAAREKANEQAAAAAMPAKDELAERLAELDGRLRDNFATLTTQEPDGQAALRREIGTAVLTAVRSAAGRVIDRDFGEGIPDTVNLHALEGRFLGFVRDTLRQQAAFGLASDHPTLEHDLRRLLITLADHDATAEADMKLVMHGSAVVSSLLGVDSLPGVMAQLNVLVSGRGLIDTDLYVAEMVRLGHLAESLRDDAATKTFMNWVRRLPEDQRLPSPIRVASYCRSNATTRLLDKLFAGDLDPDALALADATQPPRTYLQLALDTHDRMLELDAGFTLTLTTHLLRHVVVAHLTRNKTDALAHLESLGPAKSLDRLEALIKFDNNDELVAEAQQLVIQAHPSLKRQLVCVR
ncbi:hypothetical protein [Algisphaera agarilytica]|uniref:Uncharacterized protein n=1 Tax=Algisphaera agarilytica TaxID=1385975 RepID=A0A7X0H6Z1_9BACT|nr:hypothetical protein [Algisphaera agarilytica]MBB6430421.1 hypothetical protein [Algisphaera agarilytica]